MVIHMIVYIQEQNTVVQKRLAGLEVRKQGELLYRIPIINLDRLIIIGNPQISTQALHFLASKGIDVCYLTRGGKVGFTLRSSRSNNVFLRLA